ncbi:MAG: thioredoxin domain-containing protein [Nakamurella sp.]
MPTEAQRTAVGSGPKGSARQRQSVAPGSSGGNNRTQLIIWGAAIAVIVAVIVVGIVWNISNNKVENAGYGTAAKSTVTMDANGIITMSVGAPTASFDVYEDPLCPYCADFERKYGQQIAQAVDDGKVAVNYHLLNFLDQGSGSGDYSSRATGAMMCAATNIGSTPGAWASLHSKLYEDGVQPTENSVSDMTNEQLAQYVTGAATGAGLAPDAAPVTAAVSCVNSGAMLPTVTTAYNVSAATLTQLVGGVRSPVIVSNGALVDPGQTTWLSTITG